MKQHYLASALKQLAEGEFVCDFRFPDEFDALDNPEGRKQAEEWLQAIGYRLVRLSDDGAFFMAHSVATTDVKAQLRDEMRNIRNRLHPVVSILETVRKTQARDPRVHAGDMLYVSQIAEAARASSMLENQIMEMREVSGVKVSDNLSTRVQNMLAILEREGYLRKTNPTTGAYQITGKIDYLYQLIAYITAHAPQLADESFKDQIDQPDAQLRLDAAAGAGGGV